MVAIASERSARAPPAGRACEGSERCACAACASSCRRRAAAPASNELGYVHLPDALAILLVIDAKDDERSWPAAVRWAGRLAPETPDLQLAELAGALEALRALPDEHAQRVLPALAERARPLAMRAAPGPARASADRSRRPEPPRGPDRSLRPATSPPAPDRIPAMETSTSTSSSSGRRRSAADDKQRFQRWRQLDSARRLHQRPARDAHALESPEQLEQAFLRNLVGEPQQFGPPRLPNHHTGSDHVGRHGLQPYAPPQLVLRSTERPLDAITASSSTVRR